MKDTYYLGGHYGGMSEQMMMKELRAHGPMLIDFNAGATFQAYKSGILSEDMPVSAKSKLAQVGSDSDGELSMADRTSNATQEDLGLQWSRLTHSTHIVGWGEENGIKYWIVRNSYGPAWGENGNLRLRRGRNDFGCESENIVFTPELLN